MRVPPNEPLKLSAASFSYVGTWHVRVTRGRSLAVNR